MLYGRDAERALIDALLGAARESRSGSLVIRGEAGLGKTALLADARERAGGMHVLAARGVESESELPFAGLHQLTRPAVHLLERLPEPQAGALAGALGLAESGGEDRFLISAACLSLLAELAEERPVLCLVDDAQWLDRASADALLFVARRLDAEGVVILFGAREGDGRRFEARELADVELGGLDATAAAALVERGGAVAPAVRDLLVERAQGNALALVELPGALSAAQLAGERPLPDALPLTRDVERLFEDRLRRLPEPARRLLALIAADDTGRLDALTRATRATGVDAGALADVERAGLISVADSTVELRHPLVRSAVHHGAPAGDWRAAHLALADAFGDEADADRRAWHRAAAALGPDAEVAAELERTAERARQRGGHAAAAAALERAADLSTDVESEARRLAAAAAAAWRAGRPARATALCDRAGPLAADPPVLARLAHVRGVVEFRCGRPLDAAATLLAGAGDAEPRRALEMLFDAGLAAVDAGDYAQIVEAGRRAAALPRSDDGEVAFLADLLTSVGSLVGGTSASELPLVLDVIARAAAIEEPRWLIWAAAGATLSGDEAAEAVLLSRAVALARASGAVDALTMALLTVTVNGVTSGRLGVEADAREGLQLAREARLPNAACIHEAVLAWCAAHRGDDDRCSALAAGVQEAARAGGLALANAVAEWGLALLELGRGRPDDAAARLIALRGAPPGVGHPLFVLSTAADLVEACVRAGRDDDATAAYAVLDGFARPGAAPAWALAQAARCRGLIAQDESELENALALHGERARPLDRARTELLLGEQLRRRRRRVAARERLRAAHAAFGSLGAALWAARAEAELRASGETARKREPGTLAELTPQELQVARFVGEGLSNKEVAAQLFLSPRTIDAHLRSVFAKLDITSRTQLARLPLGER